MESVRVYENMQERYRHTWREGPSLMAEVLEERETGIRDEAEREIEEREERGGRERGERERGESERVREERESVCV